MGNPVINLLKQEAKAIWICGLPASGKTTLATCLEKRLTDKGFLTKLLDGDIIRSSLNSDLGYSIADRREQNRRVAEVGRLFLDAGIICVMALLSPLEEFRELARKIIGANRFKLVYLDTPLDTCHQRDNKGHYILAKKGELSGYTGVGSPFEVPANPDLILSPHNFSIDECALQLLSFVLPLVEKR